VKGASAPRDRVVTVAKRWRVKLGPDILILM